MNNILKNKYVALLVALVLLIFLVAGIISSRRDLNPDSIPEEPSINEYSKSAKIIDPSSSLVQKIGGIVQYDMLSRDLRYFGSVNYEKYKKNTSGVVGFLIKGDVNKNDSVIEFIGVYGASSNKVKVRVELLANKRIKTSITDTVSNINVDSQLDSNSQFNVFISKLPITKTGYTVEYSSIKNQVVVHLTERNPALYEQALIFIKSTINDGSYNSKMITSLFPPNSFGQ